MESAIFIKTSGTCDCVNVRVKIQDMSSRMNTGYHPGNKSVSIKGSLEAFFHCLIGTPGKLGIQGVVKSIKARIVPRISISIRRWINEKTFVCRNLLRFSYFDCSGNAKKYINWEYKGQNYPFEQFYDEFYSPVLLSSFLSGGDIKITHDLSQGFNLPPEVSIISPKPGDVIKSEVLEVEVAAVDMGGGIEDIRLYHQEKMVGGGKNLIIVPGEGKKKNADDFLDSFTGSCIESAQRSLFHYEPGP